MLDVRINYSLVGKRVWVAGHSGMVGAAIVRRLIQEEVAEILTVSRRKCDLRRQGDVESWLSKARPDAIFVAAAKVGGILANSSAPADFLYDNLIMEANIIHGAHIAGVEKLLFLGSSCIYPKFAPQPIAEDALLSGALEPTNQWYAIAKIAGLKLCEAYREQYGCNFISAMPTNLYGPGDNYDLTSSHVIPALIRKAHEAKSQGSPTMEIWGSGEPMREFLHVDDCADALIFLMKNYTGAQHVNVGSGKDLSIADVARLIMKVVGFGGDLAFDRSKPDGTPRKLMAADKLETMGWRPKIRLEDGIAATYRDWLANGGADDRRWIAPLSSHS